MSIKSSSNLLRLKTKWGRDLGVGEQVKIFLFILLLSLYAEVVWACATAALSGQGQLVGAGCLLSSVGPEDSTQ